MAITDLNQTSAATVPNDFHADEKATELPGARTSLTQPKMASKSLALSSADDLHRLPIAPEARGRTREGEQAYNVRAPAHYMSLVNWSDPNDPIRLQTIPLAEELRWDAREEEDPIGDHARSPVPRLTHRYPDRVLLYPSYQCAVYCRHCFRKESLSDSNDQFADEKLQPAFRYIEEHPEVCEVILTGGDPLMLSNSRLESLRQRLEAIPHVRMMRFHSRIPVVLPSRINPELVRVLKGRLMVCIVTHFNHANEIAPANVEAARLLREGGFMLLNQTVLLKGVNDDTEKLRTLFRELVYTLGIKPYYLHHCDLTRGLTHFRTTIDRGRDLMRQLRGHTSGLCIPTYVLDLPGGYGKTPLGPDYVEQREGFEWDFRNYEGVTRHYTEVVDENPPLPPA